MKKCMWPAADGEGSCTKKPVAYTEYCRQHHARIHFLVQSGRLKAKAEKKAEPKVEPSKQQFQCNVCRLYFLSLSGLLEHTCQ